MNDCGNVVREIVGKFARKPPHFAGHFFLSNSTLISQLGIIICGYIYDRKMWFGKKMAKLTKTRLFIPVIIIPSKVLDHIKRSTLSVDT